MVARVGQLVETDDAAGIERSPAAQASDQRVSPGQRAEQLACGLRDPGFRGVLHDRRDGPVDIGENRRAAGILPERREQLLQSAIVCRLGSHRRSIARHAETASTRGLRMSSRTLKLAAIGTAGGVFSGLLGVGGGSVIVPLLIVWLGYGPREATGTSMMAIVVIAAVAVTLQATYGNVDPANAALVGVPAIGGAVAGTALQQRLPERAIALLFAGLLVIIAAKLIIS